MFLIQQVPIEQSEAWEYIAPSNVEAVIEAYGSPVPQEAMMQGIIWIQAD